MNKSSAVAEMAAQCCTTRIVKMMEVGQFKVIQGHHFRYFARRKSDTKFLCVKTVSSKVVGHSLA